MTLLELTRSHCLRTSQLDPWDQATMLREIPLFWRKPIKMPGVPSLSPMMTVWCMKVVSMMLILHLGYLQKRPLRLRLQRNPMSLLPKRLPRKVSISKKPLRNTQTNTKICKIDHYLKFWTKIALSARSNSQSEKSIHFVPPLILLSSTFKTFSLSKLLRREKTLLWKIGIRMMNIICLNQLGKQCWACSTWNRKRTYCKMKLWAPQNSIGPNIYIPSNGRPTGKIAFITTQLNITKRK